MPALRQEEYSMSQAPETKSNNTTKIVIAVAAAVIVVAVCVTAVILLRDGGSVDAPESGIGYAQGAVVVLDEDSLQAALEEAQRNAQDGLVALNYQNDAFSSDGKNFSCYIVNDSANLYDMFLTIFADAELTDRLLLTGLVPPGSGFEKITLDHALEKGNHTVYVAVSLVDTAEDGTQVMKAQVVHTMNFHVT